MFFLAVLLGAAPRAATASDRVVLLSWDGIRNDRLEHLLNWQTAGETPVVCPNGRHEPVMPKLCNGKLTCMASLCRFQMLEEHIIEGKPLTRPQHAQMLSGYGPVETGPLSNAGKRTMPRGYTIYERIKAARPEIRTVHVAGAKFVSKGIIRWAEYDGALDLNLRRGGYDNYSGANTTEQFGKALEYVGNEPFFIFVHYKTADVIGHRAGDKKNRYSEAIVQNDLQLAEVLRMLQERGLSDSTDVFVTTDHGFDGIFHLNFEEEAVTRTFFASRNSILRNGVMTPLDVVPTILSAFGISTANANPPYRGQSLLAGPIP